MKPFVITLLGLAILWLIASSRGPLAFAGMAALFQFSPQAFIPLAVIMAILVSIN